MPRRLAGIAALAVLLARPAGADGLADVRAALGRVGPPQPVRVRVETRVTKIEKKKQTEKTLPPVVVEHGPDGLRLTWDSGQVDKTREAPQGQPGGRESGASRGLANLTADEALELVDATPSLRRLLAGATLLSDREGTLDGQPARVLVVRPANKMTEKERKEFKTFEETLTLTLGVDGLPRLAEHAVDLKITKLLITATASQKETRRYASVAGRLVVTSSEESSSGSALGQSGEQRTARTVAPF